MNNLNEENSISSMFEVVDKRWRANLEKKKVEEFESFRQSKEYSEVMETLSRKCPLIYEEVKDEESVPLEKVKKRLYLNFLKNRKFYYTINDQDLKLYIRSFANPERLRDQ